MDRQQADAICRGSEGLRRGQLDMDIFGLRKQEGKTWSLVGLHRKWRREVELAQRVNALRLRGRVRSDILSLYYQCVFEVKYFSVSNFTRCWTGTVTCRPMIPILNNKVRPFSVEELPADSCNYASFKNIKFPRGNY